MKLVSFLATAAGFLSGVMPLCAQLPQPGTDEVPKWYYIQVVGEDARRDRVFSIRNGSTTVYGEPIINSADMEEVSTQLWRFVPDGEKYAIVNRATGMMLDVAFDSDLDISKAVLSQNSETRFELKPYENQFQIVSSRTPAGGLTNEIYLHQGNGGTRDYTVMMVSSYWSQDLNSQFHFLAFEDFDIEYSTDDKQVYYNLVSGKSEFGDKCLTYDVNADYPLILRAPADKNHSQQWSVIDAGNGKVYLKNRATGHVIKNESVRNGSFNRPQLDELSGSDEGCTLTYVGGAQYMVSAFEEDGIERMLNASVGDKPDTFRDDEVRNSGFGWKFRKVTDDLTAIDEVKVMQSVRVEDGRVIADKGVDYRVFSVDGRRVPAGERLQTGVYIIEAAGSAGKFIVQ